MILRLSIFLAVFYFPLGICFSYVRSKSDTGKPLFWRKSPIPFVIDSQGLGDFFVKNPKLGKVGSEFLAVQYGFSTWANVVCPGGKKIPLKWAYQGKVSGQKVGFDQSCDNCNTNLVIFVRKNWPYDSVRVAVTTTSYNNSTGEILDADIELNAEHYTFSTTEEKDYIRWDIQSVVTHEVGHFLGLGHSNDPKATMREQYDPGKLELRYLQKDDILGICSIYAPNSKSDFPLYKVVQSDRGVGCSISEPFSNIYLFLFSLLVIVALSQVEQIRFFVRNKD